MRTCAPRWEGQAASRREAARPLPWVAAPRAQGERPPLPLHPTTTTHYIIAAALPCVNLPHSIVHAGVYIAPAWSAAAALCVFTRGAVVSAPGDGEGGTGRRAARDDGPPSPAFVTPPPSLLSLHPRRHRPPSARGGNACRASILAAGPGATSRTAAHRSDVIARCARARRRRTPHARRAPNAPRQRPPARAAGPTRARAE